MRACSTDDICTHATHMLYTNTMEMKLFLVPLFYCPWLQQPPPQNTFNPGAPKGAAKGKNCSGFLLNSSFPLILAKKIEPTTFLGGRVSFQSLKVRGLVRSRDFEIGLF